MTRDLNRGLSWRILTFRGIDLRVHISLLALLVYVVILSAAQLPFVARSAGVSVGALSGGPWTWGFVFAVALVASIALHEFGHALVGQHQGLKVKGITLMMLGGVSEMETLPDRPFHEFKLAIIGPIVSLLLALFLFVLADTTGSADLQLFCRWLGRSNLALAIFNMLPAFPLDGGRALRAALAARRGKLAATRIATSISQGFAWALGIFGLLGFNFLLVLIAFFIYGAARSELFMMVGRTLVHTSGAGDVALMTAAVSLDDSVENAARAMVAARSPAVPVTGVPAIVLLEDVRRVPRNLWDTTRVSEVLSPVRRVIAHSEPLDRALEELFVAPKGILPVAQQGKLFGILRLEDVMDLVRLRSLELSTEEPAKSRRRAA